MIRVLIADDSPDLREIVRFFLEKKGFEVIEASDGQSALAKALEVRPDCIILDLLMPIQDGFVTLEEIRKHAQLADTSVIILSSLSREQTIVRVFKAGACDFIKKPFSPHELFFRIVRALPETKRAMLVDLD